MSSRELCRDSRKELRKELRKDWRMTPGFCVLGICARLDSLSLT